MMQGLITNTLKPLTAQARLTRSPYFASLTATICIRPDRPQGKLAHVSCPYTLYFTDHTAFEAELFCRLNQSL